jgi:hypothetical protein
MDELHLIEASRLQREVLAHKPRMTIFEATMLAEGEYALAGHDPQDVNEELIAEAYQLLIDTGTVWQLQGAFGRAAVALIEAGVCSR